MTQASLSPNRRRTAVRRLAAGPLAIELRAPASALRDHIEANLGLFDVEWHLSPLKRVTLGVDIAHEVQGPPAEGRFLVCAQMHVDPAAGGLRATTTTGALLEGELAEASEHWRMSVPVRVVEEGRWPEIEDLLSLVVTTGWRRAGWVPLHAAGVTDGERGLLVCAASRGGKTTFSLALLGRGWRLLGDDKLLVAQHDSAPRVAAIKQMLNVDPASASWFPEIGDLSQLPEYSAWSPKRRVSLASIWPDRAAYEMIPTHLALIVRAEDAAREGVERLVPAEVIATLMRQTVIPSDPAVARPITAAIARVAQSVAGYRVTVPTGAYADPRFIERIESALQ